MSKNKSVYVKLTEGELKELINGIGHYKVVLRSRWAKRQHKYGYRDDSPSRKRHDHASTGLRKLSQARKTLEKARKNS